MARATPRRDDGPVDQREDAERVEPSPAVAEAKVALRARLSAARAVRDPVTRAADAQALADAVLDLPEVRAARTVSAYVARASEPGTGPLLAALVRDGVRVLLPVLTPGLVLDWADYRGPGELMPSALPGNRSLLEPTGPRLGPDAVTGVDVVLAPGLAVGPDGTRMGFGGGCYDRALALLRPDLPVVALLYDDELVDTVPAEAHDRRVSAVVTPRRVVRFS
jgi:5-formyltetrahydrofolate cyclo-ligase